MYKEKLKNKLSIKTSGLKLKNYITTISADKSKDEVMGTLTIRTIFTEYNWSFLAPKVQDIIVNAGIFDNKVIFSGRTWEATQDGYVIETKVNDQGYKLKKAYSGDNYSGDIRTVLKQIVSGSGLKLILKDIKKEKISREEIYASEGSSTTVGFGKGISGSFLPSCSRCAKYYNKGRKTTTFDNYCPNCKKSGTLTVNPKGTVEGEYTCTQSKGGCDSDFCGYCGKEKMNHSSKTLRGVSGNSESTTEKSTTTEESSETTETTESNIPKEKVSIEEELKKICDSRDYHITVTPTGYCVIQTPNPPSRAEFTVQRWMMKKHSYKYLINIDDRESSNVLNSELDISTVCYVTYNKGTLAVRIKEFSDMYGDVNPIKIKKKKLNKSAAYELGYKTLIENMRKRTIEIEFEMLLTGEVYPGRWIKVFNPRIKTWDILWVDSININIQMGQVYSMQVKCLYMPNLPPQEKETTSTGDLSSIEGIGRAAARFRYSGACQTAACLIKVKSGDCWAMSDYLYQKLTSAGIKAQIRQYGTSGSPRHRSVMYWNNGKWVDFPYRKYGISRNFRNTSSSKTARVYRG